jgi:hypothetical protein
MYENYGNKTKGISMPMNGVSSTTVFLIKKIKMAI